MLISKEELMAFKKSVYDFEDSMHGKYVLLYATEQGTQFPVRLTSTNSKTLPTSCEKMELYSTKRLDKCNAYCGIITGVVITGDFCCMLKVDIIKGYPVDNNIVPQFRIEQFKADIFNNYYNNCSYSSGNNEKIDGPVIIWE